MTATHAKGPWTWAREYGEVRVVTREDADRGDYDNVLADVYGGDVPEQEANAHLVAASPELLAACKKALAALELEHSERQARIDQMQDEWNHRHADDINVPNDPAIWGGVEVEESPVLASLRAAIAKAEGR